MKKILIAVTNTPTYGEKDAATGLWLGEAAEFVDEVSKRGFEVDYVSPKGGFAPLDPRSMKKAYADHATIAWYRMPDFKERALACTLRPEEVDAGRYDALYYTGGHGVMWDFPSSEGRASGWPSTGRAATWLRYATASPACCFCKRTGSTWWRARTSRVSPRWRNT